MAEYEQLIILNLSEMTNDIRRDADQNDKLRTDRIFKTIENFKCEDYLRQVTNTRHRITLTKLRLSNHKLATENGPILIKT